MSTDLWLLTGTPGWVQTDHDSAGGIPVNATLSKYDPPIDTATVAVLNVDVPEIDAGAGAELTVDDLISLRDAIDELLTGLPDASIDHPMSPADEALPRADEQA